MSLTNLCAVNLSLANLTEANLCGANLEGATLYKAHLNWARFDNSTTWPDDFDPIEAGAINPEEQPA